LAVKDDIGQLDEDSLIITVTAPNNPPVVDPTATPNTGHAPLVVQFMANASDPENDPLTYAWDFGDPTSADNTSTVANPQHVYNTSGTYVAWVTVSDGQHEVSGSATVVVESAATLSVRSAKVVSNPQRPDQGNVTLRADFDSPMPAPDDVISVDLDGINLVNALFSEFKSGSNGNVYWLSERRLLVRIDFDAHDIFVNRTRVDVSPLDNSNGVDVEVRFGDVVGVETIWMEMVSPSVLRYGAE
jgi:hypothetical protein